MSNEQKVTGNEQKLISNEQKLLSNEQRAKSLASFKYKKLYFYQILDKKFEIEALPLFSLFRIK